MKRMKRLRPDFRISLDKPLADPGGMREVLPFRRSWLVIGIIALVDLVFLVPAFGAYQQASGSWARMDTLMDLTSAVFTTAWLLGWSVAPLILTLVLAVMLFGREVVRAGPGKLEIGIGLPGLVLFIAYDPARLRNLRLVTPEKNSGTSWRGRHMAFDDGGYQIDFGSAIDEPRLADIRARLQRTTGTAFREGDATDAELSEQARAAEQAAAIRREKKQVAPAAPISEAAESAEALPLSHFYLSTLLLVGANLIPILGWWLWGWRLSDVMVLYWGESAVIGFFNLCKMAVINRWLVLLSGPFFLGHFGGFMAVHFMFIYALFIEGFNGGGPGDSLAEVAALFTILWPALLALFLSHGLSFFTHFIGRKEYLGKSLKEQMTEPYSRIIFMHMVLIFGGGLAMFLGDAGPVILLVILLKIILDLRAHIKQHRKNAEKVLSRAETLQPD